MAEPTEDRLPGDPSALPPEPGSAVQVHLVPLRRRHLRQVLRIEAQVYPRPWSLAVFLSEIGMRTSRVYVAARVDGIVVGYAGLLLVADEGHITNIAVDPAWHRHGIGSRLLSHLAEAGLAAGARHLTLEVRVSNAAAQAMYRRFGFTPAGVRRNYYAETNEDALVMWVHDIDSPDYAVHLAGIRAGIPGTTVVEPVRAVPGRDD